MLPALHDGDLLHVVPRSWTPDGYRRGAVVVVKSPAMDGSFWVKRVIGLPGEFVTAIDSGRIVIDDVPLTEPYRNAVTDQRQKTSSWLCDDQEYFLLGDNRADSNDSRRYGPVPLQTIIGRVWFSWPPRHSKPMGPNPR
jgi:signal peptidase I